MPIASAALNLGRINSPEGVQAPQITSKASYRLELRVYGCNFQPKTTAVSIWSLTEVMYVD